MLGSCSTNGKWLLSEAVGHINVLGILAPYFALKSFKLQVVNKHFKLMIDNTIAVAVINHMGTSRSEEFNSVVVRLWSFCFEK